ncbi:biotin--[acetyl-CoA-carboxylase] ligase [Devosia sp. MSA67]|uniref:biotin--[biotin carboxyl-carrier protein] ligase n=1 Tax=Devosia sediminis TaxID=2798801 RepID=A0A934IYA2_9HYPH|nr:biotin--[acetyl-CoA-carboxylase] ligase [Devosia sediminis]
MGAKAKSAGYRLRAYDTVGSTTTEAIAAGAAGDPGGIWFVATDQTAGRGRRGRVWQHTPGNLAATLLIVPDADPAVVATLGFVAGVAIGTALHSILPAGTVKVGLDAADGLDGTSRVALKWPNDVLADGAKLVGIGLEATRRDDGRHAVAIGIGVNIVAAPADLAYPATSLAQLGANRSAADLFEVLSDAWVDAFGLWNDGRGIGAVLQRWRASAAGIGAPVAVNQNGEILRGIFETIDDAGRLIIRTDDDHRVAITAGDVHFGATASARS